MKLLTTIELDECGSTNDEAWKYVGEPTLIVTRKQTKGRGRQGREWVDSTAKARAEVSNIFASLVIPNPGANLYWYPLAAGVSMIDAIQEVCSAFGKLDELHLKWPNDILWNDQKMGGILCESRVLGEKVLGIVIGIGLNLVAAPELTEMKTASLLETALKESADGAFSETLRWALLHRWSEKMLGWSKELSLGETESLRASWLKFARLDRFPNLMVHNRNGEHVKIQALDLDESGKLKASIKDTGKIVYLDQADSI